MSELLNEPDNIKYHDIEKIIADVERDLVPLLPSQDDEHEVRPFEALTEALIESLVKPEIEAVT